MEDVQKLSERNVLLAFEYRKASTELGLIRKDKAVKWLEIRKGADTDKQADMQLAATDEGRREAELSYLLKGLEKEMSAIKAHLRVLDVFGN